MSQLAVDALPWVKHTDTHWQLRELQLDYWPTRFKWRHNNVTHLGQSHYDVIRYISTLSADGTPTGRAPLSPKAPHDRKFSREADWGYCCISGAAEIWIFGNPHNKESRDHVIRGLSWALREYVKEAQG